MSVRRVRNDECKPKTWVYTSARRPEEAGEILGRRQDRLPHPHCRAEPSARIRVVVVSTCWVLVNSLRVWAS